MSPRSILKSDIPKSSSRTHSHVHFPPSPSQLVSATYYAHSAAHYDRTPLIVAPNECALPRRNCPERTYVLCDREARLLTQVDAADTDSRKDEYDANSDYYGRHAQRSYPSSQQQQQQQQQQRLDYFSSPPSYATSSYPSPPHRVPDLTWSESDDSDGLISPPINVDLRQSFSSLSISSPSSTRTRIQKPLLSSPIDVSPQDVLSFLPHPPLPPHERKRSLSPRNRERKERTYSSSDSDGPVFTTTRPKSFRPRYSTTPTTFASDIPPDSGCFSGF